MVFFHFLKIFIVFIYLSLERSGMRSSAGAPSAGQSAETPVDSCVSAEISTEVLFSCFCFYPDITGDMLLDVF